MSDQTLGDVQRATATAEAERVKSEGLKQELLDRIAAGIPARIDSLAKHTAESEPEVTRQLGSEGIRAMRTELAEKAGELAADVRSATAAINWPNEESLRYGEARTRHLDAALFNYLHGQRLGAIAQVLKSKGFAIHDDNARQAQGIINPQDLYSQQWLAPLADARSSLSAAEARVRSAKQADDEATIKSIWEGS